MNQLIKDLIQCLCPAGNGVFTVYTARHYREALQQLLYDGIGESAMMTWQEQLPHCISTKKPMILGIASDNGGGIMRGANWGPLFVRNTLYRRLSIDNVFDLGDVRVIPQLLLDAYLSETLMKSTKAWLYHDEGSHLPVSPLSIADFVANNLYQYNQHLRLFTIGGDHSCSYPVVKAYLRQKNKEKKRVALIQFDAHTDIMKSRMGVPICFGSWTYHILNELMDPSLLVQIGTRASSKTRNFWEQQYGIKQYWAHDVLENTAEAVAKDIIDYLSFRAVDELYISFDIDAIDSAVVSATGTPESEGLTLRDAEILINALQQAFNITGADMMEVAPFVQHLSNSRQDGAYQTLEAASTVSYQLLNAMRI